MSHTPPTLRQVVNAFEESIRVANENELAMILQEKAGTLELTLFLLGLVRLMLPKVLMPATTALSTIHPDGRKMGILAGANVVMPNLSPQENRKLYSLYDNKRCMGDEAAEGLAMLRAEMEEIGYEIVSARGDALLVFVSFCYFSLVFGIACRISQSH